MRIRIGSFLFGAALVVAALSTLLQLFPIGKKYRIGSGLPIIMGVSFAYVPSMQAIADGYGIDTILGAQIVGGVVAVIMGIMVKKIEVFFPPLIHRNSGIYHRTFPCIPLRSTTWLVEPLIRIMAPGRTGWWLSLPLQW